MESILFLAHVDEPAASLSKIGLEALGTAIDLAAQMGTTLAVGLIGEDVKVAADLVASSARLFGSCSEKRRL